MSGLSLETGSGSAFEPALAPRRRLSFVAGQAIGDFVGSCFNRFLHFDLSS